MRRLVLALVVASSTGCSLLVSTDGYTGGAATTTLAEAGVDGATPPATPPPGAEAGADAGDRYTAEVIADKPVAYFPLDETDGTVAHDRSGNGHDGTLTNAVAITFGVKGAITSSANNVAVDIPNSSGVNLGRNYGFPARAPFTFEVWVKPHPGPSGYRWLWGKMAYANNNPSAGMYVLFDDGAPVLLFERWIPTPTAHSDCTVHASTTLAKDRFTHVVVVSDGQSGYLFLDGALVASSGQSDDAVDADVDMQLGASMDGVLDEVAIYDKALGATRIKAHFDAAH